MPPRINSSSIEPTKRKLTKHRDLWLDFFSMSLDAMIPRDEDGEIKGISETEAQTIALSARNIADAALSQAEERFKGL